MALRLTDAGSSPEPRSSGLRLSGPAAGASWSLTDAEQPAALQARAAVALARHDLVEYASLWKQAGEIEDRNRSYQARCLLAEAVMGHQDSSMNFTCSMFTAMALHTVEMLEQNPCEPRVANLAGVAFYELGEWAAAEKLFEAAYSMAPEIPSVGSNREVLKRRKAGGAMKIKLPATVVAALHDLVPRAKRAAARAKPATGLTLSLCMIVKDEEEMLPRCLEAVQGHVDELIIVDTGSTDRTVAIAEEFGATVLHHEWNGSFSDARNVSFEAATSDWIMYLDADEVLVAEDASRLRDLTGHTWREAFYLIETNFTGEIEDGTSVNHNALRVFRNRPHYRFDGRIHEQIADKLPAYLPERLTVTDIRVEHYGYLGVVRDAKEKSRRNLDLLMQQSEEGIDTPFHHYNLGSEYSGMGDSAKSLEHLELAWERLLDDPRALDYGYVPSLFGRVVQSLRVNQKFEACIERGNEVLAKLPGFTDVVLEQSHSHRMLGNLEEAKVLLQRCLEMGDAPSRYSATVGCGTYLARTALADLHRQQGELEEAEALLTEVRREYPNFLTAVEPLAEIMAERGRDGDEIVAAVEAGADLTAATRFVLAVPLHERGFHAQAEDQLRAALAKQPEQPLICLALGETLLAQGKMAEAQAAVAPIGPDSPWGVAAARTVCFARLADDPAVVDGSALDDALSQAREAGLDGDELQIFSAWRGRRDAVPPPSIGPGAASPALVMLEALLRIEAFDQFAELLAVFDAVSLPARERHERLATMYLRRGFLESAGDEWVAVVQELGADTPALLGLAQVAYLRDMPEDAVLLAEEVKRADPGNATAARILELVAAAA